MYVFEARPGSNESKSYFTNTYIFRLTALVYAIKHCLSVFKFQLRSVPDELDSCSLGHPERYSNILLTIRVDGSSSASKDIAGMALPTRPSYVSNFLDVDESEIHREKFVIEASFFQLLNRRKFSGKNDFQ